MTSPLPGNGPAAETTAIGANGTRTLLSFLLFLHLAALVIGVTSNQSPSALEAKLREVPAVRAYLQLLGMDLSYAFHLTYFQPAQAGPPALEEDAPTDTDHFIELDLKFADGTQRQVRVPELGTSPALRFRRYERLAFNAASLVDDQTLESNIPYRVALRVFQETNATEATIRVRRHVAPAMEAFRSPVIKVRDPADERYFRTLLEFHATYVDGVVELIKKESAGDVAPGADGQKDDQDANEANADDTSKIDTSKIDMDPDKNDPSDSAQEE